MTTMTSAVTLPPGPTAPRAVQGAYALTQPLRGLRRRVLGPHSMFALSGDEHRRQRKLLVPPFHGRRLAAYEKIVEEESVRELASRPEGKAFATLPSMMRITLNAILRAVFGADGAEFAELRELLPPFVALGSRLAVAPISKKGRFNPWRRFERMRREYDAVFPHAATFDPHRFEGARPDLYQWIPFGGGTRRCLGAAFATMEMTVVLRTLLRDCTLEPTTDAGERRHSRGVAYAPAKGGRAIVRRRSTGGDS
ncbi:cytochrome P450 [Amycolatopsis sp. NPDC051061]|uniref:cytochrome P450 n=1 Tax=Amycolatopsis sp. NPDC051061 TaxID=3155042 RepID=UPI00341CCC9D